ncbi:MAG: uracil-DNA glycosylase [Bacilli bacterium]|jgi:uracil-DNA glycosylase
MIKFGNDWDIVLKEELASSYYQNLRKFLCDEYSNYTVYPNANDIFTAFKLTSYKDVRVVIIGQDPYHGEGQAHGLAFSVQEGISLPPSLKNIYKELEDDLGIKKSASGDLTNWAKQGVLLLNATLTVRGGLANSHKGYGWEEFTDNVIRKIVLKDEMVIFVLWGNDAKKKEVLINNPKHKILKAAHPSPLSAYNGFFGCKHFSMINTLLEKEGFNKIKF